MRRYIINCDHCGNELEEKDVLRIQFINGSDEFGPLKNSLDICKECGERILAFSYEKEVKEKEEKKEVKPVKKKEPAQKQAAKKEVELDAGKIFALHNAGWTFSKIKSELGVDCRDSDIAKAYRLYLEDAMAKDLKAM